MALRGFKVIEFAGLAPGPFAGLVLADHGASVIRVDRPSSSSIDVLWRRKRSLAINSKVASGREALKRIISTSDVLIDPFRPGVLERLGLGPEVFFGSGDPSKRGLNEKLVYARITGFPREGKHKDMAGHDINYLAQSGIFPMLPGPLDRPSFPLNLLADFAGGGLPCALGIILALLERSRSGKGQIVNTDMVSGLRYLSSSPLLHYFNPAGDRYSGPRGTNILDGGAPFYGVYPCKDGRWMSIGCIEHKFFKLFIQKFVQALSEDFTTSSRNDESGDGWTPSVEMQGKRDQWNKLRRYLEDGFKTRTRDEWAEIFDGTDACAVPVLTPEEARQLARDKDDSPFPDVHPQVTAAATNTGLTSPTDQDIQTQTVWDDYYLRPGKHTDEILEEFGFSDEDRHVLIKDQAITVER
ncbi:CoA-transferase family III [Dendrothele bispora CBS 962.96]|uniref:CoA-transferase family III n=1 Tax=Dendrothele bispora (strain CBS 962.96) TaxID=1314807 RepID=A0A4S8MK60_DENBC|nr:CoA-transferase family III [Dendrothele bispora CBS 962.96]